MKRLAGVACAVYIMVAMSGCSSKAKGDPVVLAQEAPVYAVNTTATARGLIQDYLMLSGDIKSGSTVDTYPEVAGKITQLYVSVGSRVQKGAQIAQVDPSRPGMEFIPSMVRAPIAGTIVALPAQMGMTVSQQLSIAKISGGTGLEIQVNVAERFISRISVGLTCNIDLDAYPGESFQGLVTEVSPTVDPASRTMLVTISLDNPDGKLKSGMFAKVKIITERRENIVKIPYTAVVNRFGEDYVFTVENNVAKRQVIKQGVLIDGIVEVQSGLRAGQEVVIRGQSLLEDGSRVNVVERQNLL